MTSLFGLLSEDLKKLQVWEKGKRIPGLDANIWREDDEGNRIKFSDYGNRDSIYGWEKDHFPIPAALGGSNDISNLRPLRCKTNASLGGLLGGLISSKTR